MEPEEIPDRIETFKADLGRLGPERVVRKYSLSTQPYAISPDVYFELQVAVAERFEIHPSEVTIVGSGQLGFSIAPQKRFRHFGNNSDIDLAIVSPPLFERVWKLANEYWRANRWWPEIGEFRKYLFRGWIRPDKMPPKNSFEFCAAWWEFFRSLTASGDYGPFKINAGLYSHWYFFEAYHVDNVTACAAELVATDESGEEENE